MWKRRRWLNTSSRIVAHYLANRVSSKIIIFDAGPAAVGGASGDYIVDTNALSFSYAAHSLASQPPIRTTISIYSLLLLFIVLCVSPNCVGMYISVRHRHLAESGIGVGRLYSALICLIHLSERSVIERMLELDATPTIWTAITHRSQANRQSAGDLIISFVAICQTLFISEFPYLHILEPVWCDHPDHLIIMVVGCFDNLCDAFIWTLFAAIETSSHTWIHGRATAVPGLTWTTEPNRSLPIEKQLKNTFFFLLLFVAHNCYETTMQSGERRKIAGEWANRFLIRLWLERFAWFSFAMNYDDKSNSVELHHAQSGSFVDVMRAAATAVKTNRCGRNLWKMMMAIR